MDVGIFRGFFIDDSGKEITDCFGFKKGTPIVSTVEIGQPSPIFIEAVEKCGAYSIPIKEVQALMKKSLKVIKTYNQILQTALKKQWDTKMALYQYTAQQKYEWFLEEYAEIANHVSNKNIASFLNITPVTLSRLRGKMKEELKEGNTE